MAEFALVSPADEIDRIRSDIDPDVQTKDGWRWLPVERSTSGAGAISDPAVTTVLTDKVTIVTPFRDETAQEIDAQKDMQLNAIQTVAFGVLLDHENRVRKLEGKAAITIDQFKAALKAKL